MKVVSLNVNGLRAFDQKNGDNFNKFCLEVLQADIICLQEIKGSKGSLAKYHSLINYQTFSSFFKSGRHGVSTLVKKSLFCGKSEEIIPGRVLKTSHGNFIVYNCYLPYYDESKEGDKTEIIKIYDQLKENLPKTNLILCGDFNATYNMLDHYQFVKEIDTLVDIKSWVSHSELNNIFNKRKIEKLIENNQNIKNKINLWTSITTAAEEHMDYSLVKDQVEKINPSKIELSFHFFKMKALENYFFEVYQRDWMKKLIDEYIDTFRLFNSKLSQYTCWNTIFNLRPVNLGTRIDYIICSRDIKCVGSKIMPEIKGSDHCPVISEFEIDEYKNEGTNLASRNNNLLSFFKANGKQ